MLNPLENGRITKRAKFNFVLTLIAVVSAILLIQHSAQKHVVKDSAPMQAWTKFDFGDTELGRKQRAQHFLLATKAKTANPTIIFLGDSITENWTQKSHGEPVWRKYFAPLNSFNSGIGGSTTQTELWRLANGELEGIHPKVVVLMIGSNNSVIDTPADTVAGIAKVVLQIRKRVPDAKILLLSILPRSVLPKNAKSDQSWIRRNIHQINEALKALSSKEIVYLNIEASVLKAEDSIDDQLEPGGIHPSTKGYEKMAPAIFDKLQEICAKQ